MKNKSLFLIAAGLPLLFSCGGQIEGEKASVDSIQRVGEIQVETEKFKAKPEASSIQWVGKKPTRKHMGTLAVKNGHFEVFEHAILGGEFTLDMTSITNTDIKDPAYRADLERHLKSEDFFHAEAFPEGTFVITDVSMLMEPIEGSEATHMVSGNLSLRDTTNHIEFPAKITMDETSVHLVSDQFVIDRTQWKVMYNSGKLSDKLKDNLIKDEVGIKVEVKASK